MQEAPNEKLVLETLKLEETTLDEANAPEYETEETIMIMPASSPKFVCSHCGKGFSHQPSLYRHKNKECQKKPQFDCPLCDYTSYFKYTLKRHFLRKHKEIASKFEDFYR